MISEIQGVGQGVDLDGETVTVQGVVTGDFTNSSGTQNGFYIQQQEDDSDGNPATTEGVFVYDQNGTAAEEGTLVAIEGEADEYYDMTQLQSAEIFECGEAPLPEPLDVTFSIDEAAFAGMKSMRVNVEEAVVLETYQFGRYGETAVGPERQFQPTGSRLMTAGQVRTRLPPCTSTAKNSPSTTTSAAATPSATSPGCWTTASTGGRSSRPKAPNTSPNLERPEVPEVGGDVSVAVFNVLNYFTTMGSRGANNAEEFERQEVKIVLAILEMDADVLGLMEIENNEDQAVNTLVDALSERADEERYTALETGMLGTDEITTAIIYQDDTVEPVDDFDVLDESVDDRFDTAWHRPALAHTFTPIADTDETGETLEEFTVVTNHLKSKGSECGSEADNTHLMGSCDAERTAAAAALVAWVDAEETPNAVITGDLNVYDQEAPITTLEDGGYIDLREHFDGEEAYS